MLFPKCGKKATDGLIPGLNFAIWAEIVGRKRLHALWLLVPLVNFFIFFGLAIDTARSFGRLSLLDATLAVLFMPFYFIFLARSGSDQYEGPTLLAEREYRKKVEDAKEAGKKHLVRKLEQNNPYRKTVAREWFEAAVFSIFVAAFIRMFMIEAFTIPTSSMEGTLLVGDYLFVSKMSYGVRMPMTVVQVPLLHNRIPFINRESYLKNPQLSYRRIGARKSVQQNDLVVFNWPAGDSVYIFPNRTYSANQVRQGSPEFQRNFVGKDIVHRPVDKTDFYIKRCVGMPGTTFEIRDRVIYVDGNPIPQPEKVQFRYLVDTGVPISTSTLDRLGINLNDMGGRNQFHLNNEQVEALRSLDPSVTVDLVEPRLETNTHLFPHDPDNFPGFDYDNYGPIPIPAKGQTLSIDHSNIALFKRIISVYENNDLEIKPDAIYINGKLTTEYTFGQNYYWMVGDNRHNSEDSRVWGYVPEDHVVGKPVFIFFSTKNASMREGIRWERVFKSAGNL
ncbi:MAG: signal peptidase I [Saprospirales bacterium]|nr:MAG: signal peptidase I [Saprospirales bacterium]